MSPAIRGNSYAKGNSGGGAPEGNTNAVGHGAPVGNSNAAKHHGWSDSLKHYHRLAGPARESADEIIQGEREMYAEYHGIDVEAVERHIADHRDFEDETAVRDALRRVAAMSDQSHRANLPVFEEGFAYVEEETVETPDGETYTIERTKVNPAIEAGLRLSSKRRTLEKRLGFIVNERYLFVWLE